MKNKSPIAGRRSSVVLFMLIAALSGCGGFLNRGGPRPARAMYSITLNQDIYRRGSTGEAVIRNVSGQNLQYDFCERRLERQENKYWIVAYEWPTAGGRCTTSTRTIAKDERESTLFEIPVGVPAGTYRLVFSGLLDRKARPVTPEQASSKTFQVR
jgi:hypothetical protein